MMNHHSNRNLIVLYIFFSSFFCIQLCILLIKIPIATSGTCQHQQRTFVRALVDHNKNSFRVYQTQLFSIIQHQNAKASLLLWCVPKMMFLWYVWDFLCYITFYIRHFGICEQCENSEGLVGHILWS